MPEDTREKHTPAPWQVVDEKESATDTMEDSYVGKLVRRRNPISIFLGDEESPETLRANARRIIACVNFCESVPTADLEDSLQHGHTLADEDEAIVASLNEVSKERNELRDENERLKERVAELEKACDTALKKVGHDLITLNLPPSIPDAEETERVLRDALARENASREAEVPHE
jgi:cell division protein ZapA (FtsZ GTPase activity inhibitor)